MVHICRKSPKSTFFGEVGQKKIWIYTEKSKLKRDKSIIAIPKFDVPMYFKMEYTFPPKSQGNLPRKVGPLNICDPLYN